jgi:hypothetical protein
MMAHTVRLSSRAARATEGVESVRRVLLFHVKRARFGSQAPSQQRIGCGELS